MGRSVGRLKPLLMSQNDNNDDRGGKRVNSKPVFVWLLLMLAIFMLVNYSAGPGKAPTP